MISYRFLKTGFCVLATVLPAASQTPVTLMDATINNGSFQVIDPSDAPLTSGAGRRAGTGGSFKVANWTVTTSGFGGVDAPGIGAQEGDLGALANHNTELTFVSDPIFQPIQTGDTFDVSLFTARNAENSTFDYAVSVRFDDDDTTDLELLSGSDDEADSGVWIERTATGIAYTTETNASSVRVVISMANNTGGEVDQVYLDNITLTAMVQPPPPGDDDMDGISNVDEISGDLNPYDGTGNFVGAGNGGAPTNSNDRDSDDDGIEDNDEITGTNGFVTNPNSADTDNDGISDLDERDETIGFAILTDPTTPDTDGDELPDVWELENMLDPNDDGSIDEVNGPDGDPDEDELFNCEEFEEGTDPQNEDTDGDDVLDGDELGDGTDPLDPDADHDNLNDGQERDLETDPNEKDSDFDGFSDYAEAVIFMTDPSDDTSIPDVNIHMDFMVNNGSFEDTADATNPSGSVGAGCRFAANMEGQVVTLPGWTSAHEAGFVGFDCTSGQSSEGAQFAFVNAGSVAMYQSAPIPTSVGLGEEFFIQIDTANNAENETADLSVFLSFDGGPPILLGDEVLTIPGESPGEYFERNLTYTTTNGARSVSIGFLLDNSNDGNDQPKFDNVRIYSRGGTIVALPVDITDFSKDGDNVTLTFESLEGQTYTAFYSLDLTDLVPGGTPPNLDNAIAGAAGETQTTVTFNLADTFGAGSVPEVLFFLVKENLASE